MACCRPRCAAPAAAGSMLPCPLLRAPGAGGEAFTRASGHVSRGAAGRGATGPPATFCGGPPFVPPPTGGPTLKSRPGAAFLPWQLAASAAPLTALTFSGTLRSSRYPGPETPMSTALTRASYDRLKARLANVREDAKKAAKTGAGSLIVVGGGVAAGVLSSKMATLPGTNIPTAAVVGSALVAAAMTGMLDDQSDNVAAFGSGMLAAIAARETERLLAAA